MVKAMALTKGYELDGLLSKAKDFVLQVFFAGGVIRGKKLQRGSVYVFDDIIDNKMQDTNTPDNPNAPTAEQILKAYETVYLFKWLFPQANLIQPQTKVPSKPKYQPLLQTFKTPVKANYFEQFENIDDEIDIDMDVDDYQSDSDAEMEDLHDHTDQSEGKRVEEQISSQEQQKPEIQLGLSKPGLSGINKLNLAAV